MRLPIRNSNRIPNWLNISYPNLLSRPQLLSNFTSNQSLNQLNSSSRSISFTSSGSSNRASRSRKINNNNGNNNSNRIKSNTSNNSTINNNNNNTPIIPTSLTPLAPVIAHASHGLIQLDTFFAGGRPLLELPIRLSARKTVTPFTRLVITSNSDDHLTPNAEETLEALDGEELVEMVDIAPDGTPLGPSYITTLAASQASEPIRTSAEEEELLDLQREATEAALQDIEDGLPDPYEAWLIAKRTSQNLSPEVSRYLASHPPFQLPPSPSPPTLPVTNRFATNNSSLSRQTLSDLAFLRPFPSTPIPIIAESPPSHFSRSTATPVDFATQFVSPLPPSIASEFTSGFLSSALRSHIKKAEKSYEATAVSLDRALRNYKGLTGRRKGLNETRKKGEIRVWESEGGWKTVDLGAGNPGEGLFLPAEMVDLDWEDEELERKIRKIGMDSTKRKRKKKITKHKYKKRRLVLFLLNLEFRHNLTLNSSLLQKGTDSFEAEIA